MNNFNKKIAIVSMACKFPAGSDSPEIFWENLMNNKDGIKKVPANRFNVSRFVSKDGDRDGTSYSGCGGFMDWNYKLFDPTSYNISPREAANIDPQQRLLLKLSTDLFRRSGYSISNFSGRKIGVFIGGFCVDNLLLKMVPTSWDQTNAHTATGATLSMLANRISHVFDFTGPSLAIDTACSSSLVALHQAIKSIQSCESEMAVVGGVNVILSPEYYMAMSKGQFLSRAGRCATFDESADGYVRGEGAGLILLKPYEDAKKDNDNILSVILSSGVNQDGNTNGITLPNSDSQRALLESVIEGSKLAPTQIGYVEAHGTGTKAGDKAETEALFNVFSPHLKNKNLILGSVKTNIGHLEAAAGIASIIKCILIFKNRVIPPNLHLSKINPELKWHKNFRVSTPQTPINFEENDSGILVNSFGYGGTNAMVILGPPETVNLTSKVSSPQRNLPFPISAIHHGQIKDHAAQLKRIAQEIGFNFKSFCYTNATTLEKGRFQKLLWVSSPNDLVQKLDDITNNHVDAEILRPAKASFVYSGMGPHWWGMGRQLYKQEKIYREGFDEVAEIFKSVSGTSLIDAFGIDQDSSKIGETAIDQPAGFALQVGLTRLLSNRGINPTSVIGHSLGEVAAFWAAGALTLESAVQVVFHRSRLQERLAGRGKMLATALSMNDAELLIADFDLVNIAAKNSPNMLTLSGDSDQLNIIQVSLNEKNIFNQYLHVELAYHSYLMEEIKDDLFSSLENIYFDPPKVPLYSTAEGSLFHANISVADYWWKNIRHPVLFDEAFSNLIKMTEPGHVIEIGPHPVLVNPIKEIIYHNQIELSHHETLHRDKDENGSLRDLTSKLFDNGFNLNWSCWCQEREVYPFTLQNNFEKEFWIESELSEQTRFGLGGSPYLLNRINAPGYIWSADINSWFFPWLKHHSIQGQIAMPAAGYIDAMCSIAKQFTESSAVISLKNIVFENIWLIDLEENYNLISQFSPESKIINLSSGIRSQPYRFQKHASCALIEYSVDNHINVVNKNLEDFPVPAFYRLVKNFGFEYGSKFQTIKKLQRSQKNILLEVEASGLEKNHLCYPPLLDGILQSIICLSFGNLKRKIQMVPYAIEHMSVYGSLPNSIQVHIEILTNSEKEIVVSLTAYDKEGHVCLSINQLKYIALPSKHHNPPPPLIECWKPYVLRDKQHENNLNENTIFEKITSTSSVKEDLKIIEKLLFEKIQPALTEIEKNFFFMIEDPSEIISPLSNMCVGISKVLEKENYHHIKFGFGHFNSRINSEEFDFAQYSPITRFKEGLPHAPEIIASELANKKGEKNSIAGSSVLITGGTGGFGLKIADWLYLNGAHRIILASRTGQFKDKENIAYHLPPGAEIIKLDVTQVEQVNTFFEKEKNASKPIDHIFHGAMVLDDKSTISLTVENFERVLKPKFDGAEFLQSASRDLNIRHFVLFSSVASALGNQYQMAYVIANRALESLAIELRTHGIHATAIQWGAISDVGVISRNENVKKALEIRGMDMMLSSDALDRFGSEILHQNFKNPVIGIFDHQSSNGPNSKSKENSITVKLTSIEDEERRKLLRNLISETLCKTLQLSQDGINLDKKLRELGVDSLLAVELLIHTEKATGLKLNPLLFMGQYSAHDIIEALNELLKPDGDEV